MKDIRNKYKYETGFRVDFELNLLKGDDAYELLFKYIEFLEDKIENYEKRNPDNTNK